MCGDRSRQREQDNAPDNIPTEPIPREKAKRKANLSRSYP